MATGNMWNFYNKQFIKFTFWIPRIELNGNAGEVLATCFYFKAYKCVGELAK